MWDNPQSLNGLTTSLLALALAVALYHIGRWALNLPVLPLKVVTFQGKNMDGGATKPLEHVTRGELADVVRKEIKEGFITVDLVAARIAFMKLPWVRDAVVRRVWPHGLEVTLEEQMPLACWGDAGLVNTQGEVFDAPCDPRLPVFDGPSKSSRDMARHYAVFAGLLHPLQQRIEKLTLSPRRAWQISLEQGTVLELGREQMEARLGRYARLEGSAAALLNRRFSRVDLRYPNGFAVQ
ncbi:MAG TPA: cell division protein FtsQ/DivIB [Nitrosospira sp.]|jgi:cell division protein FtsQ|nr:cell division protein FtsQ/DivIB [Nitrosospira sp.]